MKRIVLLTGLAMLAASAVAQQECRISSTPTTAGIAGQQRPPGQFVTGFTPTGSLICAAPAR